MDSRVVAWRSIEGRGTCTQIENISKTPEDLYRLSDEEYLWRIFLDAPILKMVMAAHVGGGNVLADLINPVALSFRRDNVARHLAGEPRFDRAFVGWLKDKPYPVIDMRDVFAAEYRKYQVDVDQYPASFYNGHHTPPAISSRRGPSRTE